MKNLNHSFRTPEINRRNFLKKTSLFGAATLASTLLPWRTLAAMADGFPVVDTQYGKVRGLDVAGINTFRGIRYGADTSGANRFMPPVKPQKWDGVYDAFAYGPISPQAPGDPTDPYTQSVSWDAHAKAGISEDCLRLNIWTPSVDDKGGRPVFFYTHGGGFTSGSGGLAFDGDPLARLGDGVVVTVNHRLGPLGYLDLGTLGGDSKFDKAGVAGMLDLIAALEWVHENIENFGGDPGNVMIFGQSGGGAKVSTLLSMPSAKGLIHKGIIQSGATITLGSRESSKEQAQKMINEFDVSASNLSDLQNVPWTDIIEAEANSGFRPVVDGDVIPNHPCDPTAPEVSADLPIIVGYTREDGAIRDITDSPINEEGLQEWINETYSENASLILSTYKKVYPNATPFQIQSRIRTDARTRKNATIMAERKSALNRGNAYFYVVEWASPAYEGRFEACHGVDLGLFMANPRNLVAGNTAEARKMANIIGSAVAAFGKTGNPNCDKVPYWPSYNADTRATMVFDTESRVENDPTSEIRKLWDKI